MFNFPLTHFKFKFGFDYNQCHQLCVNSDPAIPFQSSSRPQCVVSVPTFIPSPDYLIISLPAL